MNRLELPARRETTRLKVRIGGTKLYLDLGFYPEPKAIGEMFIVVERTGGHERFLLDELARMTSLAVQYGAPLEDLMEGWLGTKGKIAGPVEGDERIKFATSALDYVARHVLCHYYGRAELAHVQEAP